MLYTYIVFAILWHLNRYETDLNSKCFIFFTLKTHFCHFQLICWIITGFFKIVLKFSLVVTFFLFFSHPVLILQEQFLHIVLSFVPWILWHHSPCVFLLQFETFYPQSWGIHRRLSFFPVLSGVLVMGPSHQKYKLFLLFTRKPLFYQNLQMHTSDLTALQVRPY